jgi:hypothetical protein
MSKRLNGQVTFVPTDSGQPKICPLSCAIIYKKFKIDPLQGDVFDFALHKELGLSNDEVMAFCWGFDDFKRRTIRGEELIPFVELGREFRERYI